MNLSCMRAKMATLRMSLGRKGWEFERHDGSSRQLYRDHPLYNKLFSFRENCLINPPKTICTSKKDDELRITVGMSTAWGSFEIKYPGSFETVTIDCPILAAKQINEYSITGEIVEYEH